MPPTTPPAAPAEKAKTLAVKVKFLKSGVPHGFAYPINTTVSINIDEAKLTKLIDAGVITKI